MQVMSGARAVVECLKREGVKHVFCVPGESYLDVMDALYDEPDIRLISNRHEGGAAFMAEAYAKASGNPGVVMATRGVGATNLSIGIHTACQDSTPMVVFVGQVDSKFRGREGFQEIELEQFLGQICKWTVEIRDVERIPELVQRAFRVAKTGRPGPVAVSLPNDVLSREAEMSFGPPTVIPRPKPSAAEVRAAAEALRQSRRPLIIAGGGVVWANGEEELLKLAEKWNVPVLASFRRHDVFPNNHRLYVGYSSLGTFPGILETVRRADTILAIGSRLSEVTTQGYTLLSAEQKLIQVDIEASTLGKVYAPHVGIVADAREALLSFLELDPHDFPRGEWEAWVRDRRAVYENAVRIEAKENADKVDTAQIIRQLMELLPEDAIVTNDAGNFSGWLHHYYQFKQPKTYIGPTSGAMGYGVPAAMGIKLARPQQTVVTLCGDGGFMMTVQELETAVRCQVPFIVLLFNNNMYGTIRMHQEKHHPYRVIGTELGNPDFVRLGEAFGLFTRRVTCDAEFREAFQSAVRENRPALIELVCDPEHISFLTTIAEIRRKAAPQRTP
jgi:acetolactate synthase-1/2/3 large subunit